MLTLTVACVIVAAVLGMVAYITRLVKPKRVKFTAGVWKLVHLSYEADGGDEPVELPQKGADEAGASASPPGA